MRRYLAGLALLTAWMTTAAHGPARADDPPSRAEQFRAVDDGSRDRRSVLIAKYRDGTLTDAEKAELRKLLRGAAGAGATGRTVPADGAETIDGRVVTELQYASLDGKQIPAVLSMPEGEGPFPLVVTIHGGQGNRDYDYLRTMAAPNRVSATVTALNGQPWAILAISYRAGEGALFGSEEDDVVAGIRFAKTLPRVDPERVGVVGGSHGGHLALRAAERMGTELLCVAVGSPWCTNPEVYLYGNPEEPPLSLVPQQAREQIIDNGQRLALGLERRLSKADITKLFAERSIEANAKQIVVPVLFVTSTADEQVPHVMVQPTIDGLQMAGRDVTVYTAANSPHGYYWGRDVGGARLTRGEKSAEERAEEERARAVIIEFFETQFAMRSAPAEQSGPAAEPIRAAQPDDQAAVPRDDGRRKLDPQQAGAIRKLRQRLGEMEVPERLERRTIRVGETEREYFIYVPPSLAGRPAPVVFALHGGATSTGLAMHLKVDYTVLADREGFVVVYPSGVNGWNIGSHDALSVQRRTSNADDVGFFRAMFDALEREGVGDPKRMYVTGGSNGGVMTQYLACAMPERIAGIGVMVATLPKAADTDWPKPAVPMPVVIMLGTVDTFKPWDGSSDQYSAVETVAFWRKRNGCGDASVRAELPDWDPNDGCRVSTETWAGTAPVMFYTLAGHGHGWPMQRSHLDTGTGPKTQDIAAPDAFWAFLKDQRREPSPGR